MKRNIIGTNIGICNEMVANCIINRLVCAFKRNCLKTWGILTIYEYLHIQFTIWYNCILFFWLLFPIKRIDRICLIPYTFVVIVVFIDRTSRVSRCPYLLYPLHPSWMSPFKYIFSWTLCACKWPNKLSVKKCTTI